MNATVRRAFLLVALVAGLAVAAPESGENGVF
jgi:hypothetical protein